MLAHIYWSTRMDNEELGVLQAGSDQTQSHRFAQTHKNYKIISTSQKHIQSSHVWRG